MNLPNLITLFRILLIPVLVICLIYGYYHYALIVFLVAALTDGLDGMIARTANQRTLLGAYLDPVADKMLLNTCILTLAILQLIPGWLAIIVISRDLMLVVGTLILHLIQIQISIVPTFLGKSTTVAQLCYVLLVLLWIIVNKPKELLTPFALATAAITIASGIQYLLRGIRSVNSHPA